MAAETPKTTKNSKVDTIIIASANASSFPYCLASTMEKTGKGRAVIRRERMRVCGESGSSHNTIALTSGNTITFTAEKARTFRL